MAPEPLAATRYRRFLAAWLRHPIIALTLFSLLTAAFAWKIPTLRVRTSIYDLVIEELPETACYRDFQALFGSDDIIRVVIRTDRLFDPATFAAIAALARAAETVDGVARVFSLPHVRRAVDPSNSRDLDHFAAIIAPVTLFENNLLSPDRRTTALTLALEPGADHDAVIAALDLLLAAAPDGLTLYQIGMPLVAQALAAYTAADFRRLPPITLAIIAVLLLVLFRRLHYLLAGLVCVAVALVWTFGLMAWNGVDLSMLTMIVPVFLIAVGTAYNLHILTEHQVRCRSAGSARQAVLDTFGAMTFPTVLAIVTTVIGIGSLLLNRIPAIREFAVFAACGMGAFLLVTLLLLPVLLVLNPRPAPRPGASGGCVPRSIERLVQGLVQGLIQGVIRLNLHRQKALLAGLALVTALGVAGIFRLRVETNPMGYFRQQAPVAQRFNAIARDLSGSFPLQVMVRGAAADAFEDPANLAALAHLQRFLETLPGIDKTVSLADYLSLVHYALNRFEADQYRLPDKGFEIRMAFNNFKNLLGAEVLQRFVTPDLSTANVLAFTHVSSSRRFLELRDRIAEFAAREPGRGMVVDATGFGVAVSASSQLIARGQIRSLGLTLVLVFGVMFVLFMSTTVGGIALCANLFPIVVNFGLMGWLGIELSMATSLIASIAIGLAVDDTIHYLVRYNREFKHDLNRRGAMVRTLEHVGRPIVFTTLTIGAGFSILAGSHFTPTAVFGLLMVVTMVAALVGDMLLLPTLMLHVELVTLWDLIRLKMGADPAQGIPLFRGLSKNQVHYIMMAGAIRSLPAGERLFRRGDPSDSMFAVISGRLDVLDEDDVAASPLARRIARLSTGDVVGEMGLVRAAPRSATVVAADPADLLLINRRMIRRLQWLYPPTAQKFFFNLLAILCDRLEATNLSLSAACSRDDDTGLCNRREFVTRLTREIDRARRYGTRLSLGVLALPADDAVADRRTGDAHPALGALARRLAQHVRGCDLFARVAPDTLALLLPQTPADQAHATLKRLAALTRTVGVRIAVIPCDGDGTMPADGLLAAAQDRLALPER